MASELRVNTLKDAGGNNSVAMEYVAGGSSKAWARFNGTGTLAVNDSFNTASVTDTGTGIYDPQWTNSFLTGNYAVTATKRNNTTNTGVCVQTPTIASGSVTIQCYENSGLVDSSIVSGVAHGDLA